MMLAEAAPEENHLSVQDPPARGGHWIHSGHGHDVSFYKKTEKKTFLVIFRDTSTVCLQWFISDKDGAIKKFMDPTLH
jgi:hypothetical protein